MKYATLKAERDDAIRRAVEAERLSNVAVLRSQLRAALENYARAEHIITEMVAIAVVARVEVSRT